jgi:hypothetical protein
MIYLVNFEPSRGLFDPSLQGFIDAIQSPPTRTLWHDLRDTWIIVTSEHSVNEVYDRLYSHILTKEKLLIISINQQTQYQGWLDQDAWDWLSAQIQSGALYQ